MPAMNEPDVPKPSLRQIYLNAREQRPGERASYLREVCGLDRGLQSKVEAMLRQELNDSFLETPAAQLREGGGDEVARQSFGDYKLLEEIARGGMGVVYKAMQVSLSRLVAVKMILPSASTCKEYIRRFRTESSAAANLQHPNIVAVHEVGTHEGQNFIVMDFVHGPNLARMVGHLPLRARQAAGYLRTVAEAIHYAHDQGILHRDLKPSNVLIDNRDQPRVTDFGLAKRLDGESDLTLSGQVLGSPNFMSPEQAAGVRGKVSRRTDVYGLGAILYHTLTARPPFQADSLAEMLRQVIYSDPVSPRLLNASVPRDLETITMKCLEKDPSRRYPTAQALADELARFLAGEPILARPLGPAGKAWRWCQRKPALAGAFATSVLAMALAASFAYQTRSLNRQRLAERRQAAMEKAWIAVWGGDLDRVEPAIHDAELAGMSVMELHMLRGHLAAHRGAYDQAVEHLDQAVRLAPESVSARALLAIAYARLGKWEQAAAILKSASLYPMKTPDDYLFKALAESDWDPARGLATLDKAPSQRPRVLARLIRAQLRVSAAAYSGNIADTKAALEETRIAKELVPDNVVALVSSLLANLMMAGIFEDQGETEQLASVISEGERIATDLRSHSNNVEAIWGRVQYLSYLGENQKLIDELRDPTRRYDDPLLQSLYAQALYMEGRFEEAVTVLTPTQRVPGRATDFCRGYVVAELPNGPQRALQEFYALSGESASPLRVLYGQTVLRLLGRKQEAVEICARLNEQKPVFPGRNDWYHQLLDYCCEKSTAAELLENAGPTRASRGEAHFFIALTQLGQGDRDGARQHFSKVLSPGVHSFEHGWSRAFLSRMGQDPDWPPWILANP